MTTSRTGWAGILLVATLFVLAGCAAGPNDVATVGETDLAGFWLGLWHGLISPITFLISLFNDNVSVYEVHNNGNWYDFGFIFGVFLVFSGPAGGGAARGRR
ncbi:MAG TPA: hypothetical protein VHJ83_01985 [Micromonosporaceae bacterium]|jgi:hypothetical protein|nr:hypothetical protein [Micromonosporaceae bacterium]